jgi:ABC-type microcin C transport system permease subunit YejE
MVIGAGVMITIGVILVITAVVIPIVIHGVLRTSIPPQVAVSKENEETWSALPGKYDVEIVKQYITYNCTNPEEVRILFDLTSNSN